MMGGHAQGSLLAQLRPADLLINTLFTATMATEITLILVSVHDASTHLLEIFHDDTGTTFDLSNEILEKNIARTDVEPAFHARHPGSGIMLSEGGSLGVRIDSANDLTISVYGVTATLAERLRGRE